MKYLNHHSIKALKALLRVLETTSYISHDKIMKDLDDHYAQMLDEVGEVDSDECVESFCYIVTQSINQRGTRRYLYRDDITEALGAWRASKGSRESLIGKKTTKQKKETTKEVSFRDLISEKNISDPDKLVKRLRQLIDGKKGKAVGLVLLRAYAIDKYLKDKPTQEAVVNEFTIDGSWSGVHKYMDKNNEDYMERASAIKIL